MAAAVSQLCVRQGSRLLDWFIQLKGCTAEQILPPFHLYLYLFFNFRRARVPCSFVAVLLVFLHSTTPQCMLGSLVSWLRKRNRPLRSRRCFLQKEKGYWQNQPDSLKVKGHLLQILQCDPKRTSNFLTICINKGGNIKRTSRSFSILFSVMRRLETAL